jgi:cobalt-precorrin 5A hydrolase / precorrin-3B C17-methyltransferase
MEKENKVTAVFYITEKAHSIADDIAYLYAGAKAIKFSTEILPAMWHRYSSLVFVMAAGVVVRAIAPLVRDRENDPSVVVIDENGEFVISMMSGHLGGAEDLAGEIASLLEAKPVITIPSNTNRMPSIELWASEKRLLIEDSDLLPDLETRLMNNGFLRVYSENETELPDIFLNEPDPENADIIISASRRLQFDENDGKPRLYLRPRRIVVGISCNSDVDGSEIEEAVNITFFENNLSSLAIGLIATLDKKANSPGLVGYADKCGVEIRSFTAEEINKVKGVERSEAVFQKTGAYAIAAPSAILASRSDSLLIPKTKSGNVTVAAALTRDRSAGKLYIVGIGPGINMHITQRARAAIKESDVVIGYETYLNLVPDLITVKDIITSGMIRENERCLKAIELALSGKTVSLISGGDPGIYAMAGLVYEILSSENCGDAGHGFNTGCENLSVEVIPGISALNASAARLGAPLMHDFVSISLSDGLTPWETIEKRLEAAAIADFVIVLYNPKSEGANDLFSRAIEIISQYKKPETPVGVVKCAMRPDEDIILTTLEKAGRFPIDMQTTVIVGNSGTFVWKNRMITPRGYKSVPAA